MPSLFEAYITNLGKYNEGELVGETLKFPTSPQEVQALLKHIGVDGIRYEEFFITSFDGDVLGLYDYLSEYENLDELNHLACLLSELDQGELEKFEAVIDSGEHTSSVADLINLTQNLDCYELHPGVDDEETLGRLYVDDMETLVVPDHIKPYFDYEAYSKKYLSEHEAELATYRAARATMNELLDGAKLPKMADMKKSRQELAGKKKALYAEYRKAQADMRQAVAVKANIDHLLGVTDGRENKAQER